MRNVNSIYFVAKFMAVIAILVLLTTVVASTIIVPSLYAQSGTEVKCGSIVDSEFMKENEKHEYSLNMATQESFTVSVDTTVDYLYFHIAAYGPTGAEIISVGTSGVTPVKNPTGSTGILTKGKYKILVSNWGIGPYKLYIGCTTVNGEVKPGDIAQPTSTSIPTSLQTANNAQPKKTSESVFQTNTPSTIQSLVEIGKSYEFEYGTKTKVLKVLEVRADGWIKVEQNGKWSWLNLSHVALITPVEE